jgi:heme A synthase
MNLIIRFSSTPLVGFLLCALPFFGLALFFGILAAAAGGLQWTTGKNSFFIMLAALNLMAVIILASLGILGELVVANSDLTHTDLPEVNKRFIPIESGTQSDDVHT